MSSDLVYNLSNLLCSPIANRCAEFHRRYKKFDMKKLPLILIMMSLFIFQSAWNVAAAFCQHESVDFSQVHETHFGHHQVLSECQSHQNQSLESNNKHNDNNPTQQDDDNLFSVKTTNLSQDHHDHLPSMSHLLMQAEQVGILQSTTFRIDCGPHFFWNNLYRSPDLGSITPPPLSSPLQVG